MEAWSSVHFLTGCVHNLERPRGWCCLKAAAEISALVHQIFVLASSATLDGLLEVLEIALDIIILR